MQIFRLFNRTWKRFKRTRFKCTSLSPKGGLAKISNVCNMPLIYMARNLCNCIYLHIQEKTSKCVILHACYWDVCVYCNWGSIGRVENLWLTSKLTSTVTTTVLIMQYFFSGIIFLMKGAQTVKKKKNELHDICNQQRASMSFWLNAIFEWTWILERTG